MNKSELALPHFLRFTRALALVSGAAVPVAIAIGCGGIESTYEGHAMGTAVCSASECGQEDAAAYDGRAFGAYDGSVTGTLPYDGGPVGVLPQPYDGGPVGVAPYDGGPVGVYPPPHDAGVDAFGGGVQPPPDASDV